MGKCKIYHVLKDDNIITLKKYDELLINEKNMGPIYDIIIDVNNMSKHLINYTLYDVLYLTHLVDNMKTVIKDYDIIIQLTQYIFLDSYIFFLFYKLVKKKLLLKLTEYIMA